MEERLPATGILGPCVDMCHTSLGGRSHDLPGGGPRSIVGDVQPDVSPMLSALQALISAEPFEAFTIHLPDRAEHRVARRDQIEILPSGVVRFRGDRLLTLNPTYIVAISQIDPETRPPALSAEQQRIAEKLKMFSRAKPFAPFVVRLENDRSLKIEREDALRVMPSGRIVCEVDEGIQYSDVRVVRSVDLVA